MRYHWMSINSRPDLELPPGVLIFQTNHPAYYCATLFTIKDNGLAVIEQKYDHVTKHTWWGPIGDKQLVNDIYYHPKFKEYFDKHSGEWRRDNKYPTVTVRQIMWALRMKPLKKQPWETVFDRREI